MRAKTSRRNGRSKIQARSTCLSTVASHLASTIHPHDAADTAVTSPGPAAGSDAGWIRSSYRLLRTRGLSAVEASNVVAYVAGLHAAESGWQLRQIERLVTLRSLVACGLVSP